MPPEEWRNAGLNLHLLLAQAYYKLLELVIELDGGIHATRHAKDLRAIPGLAPEDTVVSRFDQMVGPVDQRIEINEIQNRRRAGQRDTLLPKLLSGGIDLPEAEALAEEVL